MNRKPATATTRRLPPTANSTPRFLLGSLNDRAIYSTPSRTSNRMTSAPSIPASPTRSEVGIRKAYESDHRRRAVAVPDLRRRVRSVPRRSRLPERLLACARRSDLTLGRPELGSRGAPRRGDRLAPIRATSSARICVAAFVRLGQRSARRSSVPALLVSWRSDHPSPRPHDALVAGTIVRREVSGGVKAIVRRTQRGQGWGRQKHAPARSFDRPVRARSPRLLGRARPSCASAAKPIRRV